MRLTEDLTLSQLLVKPLFFYCPHLAYRKAFSSPINMVDLKLFGSTALNTFPAKKYNSLPSALMVTIQLIHSLVAIVILLISCHMIMIAWFSSLCNHYSLHALWHSFACPQLCFVPTRHGVHLHPQYPEELHDLPRLLLFISHHSPCTPTRIRTEDNRIKSSGF